MRLNIDVFHKIVSRLAYRRKCKRLLIMNVNRPKERLAEFSITFNKKGDIIFNFDTQLSKDGELILSRYELGNRKKLASRFLIKGLKTGSFDIYTRESKHRRTHFVYCMAEEVIKFKDTPDA